MQFVYAYILLPDLSFVKFTQYVLLSGFRQSNEIMKQRVSNFINNFNETFIYNANNTENKQQKQQQHKNRDYIQLYV